MVRYKQDQKKNDKMTPAYVSQLDDPPSFGNKSSNERKVVGSKKTSLGSVMFVVADWVEYRYRIPVSKIQSYGDLSFQMI